MKVGDYVRTKYGRIGKYLGYNKQYKLHHFDNGITWNYEYYTDDLYEEFINDDGLNEYEEFIQEEVIKTSPNIIDLIEVGDYVNGYLIHSIYDDDREVNEYNLKHKKCLGKNIYDEDYQEFLIYEDEIKSIVTKEQFESIKYKLEKRYEKQDN